ncbi:MAG: DNA polymerase/3'-5' exonuclease PolX [Chitinophagaceae bacterium]|nr:DNA polymerase/3'-5' exonuclease PolX [Chitinophagaceae bacterium]
MTNDQIADNFSLLSKLMDIHGENSFKAKSYAGAAFAIEKLPSPIKDLPQEKIFTIKGIGESSGKKIIELLQTGEIKVLKDLLQKTPEGVLEMLHIKGIGPKKIATIWKEMAIETIGELLYACKENRLKLYKGFGEKTQQNVAEIIEFYLNSKGSYLYAAVTAIEPNLTLFLQKIFGADAVLITGNFRTQEEIIEVIEYVIDAPKEKIKENFDKIDDFVLIGETTEYLFFKNINGFKLKLFCCESKNKIEVLFNTTGTEKFIEAFKNEFGNITAEVKDEEEIFLNAAIPYIHPCLREDANIISKAKNNNMPALITTKDIKGIIHSHSNWSDGNNTIEEMLLAAKTKGFEYLVISDHSKSAFYAKGLEEQRIREQHLYIDELNDKYPDFKIFKSIESDILNDGSLDYNNEILSLFDLVIASVHSNLKMTEEKAMPRLIKAIENPYTTILGHMTGRLLLSRKGYPVDYKKIIDACAANDVVIELNAHPNRLDIDWRHIYYALEKNVLISINPDAHSIEGFDDIQFGVAVAQKAMITEANNLSSFSREMFEEFIEKRKIKKVL